MASSELIFPTPVPIPRTATVAMPRCCSSSSSSSMPFPISSPSQPRPSCHARSPLSSPKPLPAVAPIGRLAIHCYMENRVAAVDAPTATPNELKLQLEALQTEAEQTRARANTARARFMRLTETVEKLRMRAAMDVKAGKEEIARQLIADKQKVMKALERSKQRAELLEELSAKLGEAISRKETQLIAALSSARLNVGASDNGAKNVRIVSPKDEALSAVRSIETEEICTLGQSDEEGSLESAVDDSTSNNWVGSGMSEDADILDYSIPFEDKTMNDEFSESFSTRSDVYPSFLARIDDQLDNVERKLYGFMNVAAMILPDSIGTTTNEKVATVKQIWCDIRNARARIHQTLQKDYPAR